MQSYEFEARVAEIKQRAHGRWTEILVSLGVDAKILNRRNQPCPMCGGTDRFQYTDKFGEGNYHCRGCGAGGGFKLLQGVLAWDFGTVLKQLEDCVGALPAPIVHRSGEPDSIQMKKLAKRLWDEARPIAAGDEVDRYLRNRGLNLPEYPKVLRCHPALGYFEKDAVGKSKKVAEFPAMLACVQGIDGRVVTLHRTYLQDGGKVPDRDAKKLLSAGIGGAAVRLFHAADELAIAEGIETALAVHLRTGKPVWAAISAGNMEKVWIPETVRRLCVYADNDADAQFDGQASAYVLARRLTKERKGPPRRVSVFVPKHDGTDWADVWRFRQESLSKAA